MHHEYRRPCSRSRPCHERSTGDIKETPGGQLGDSKGPAGRHSEGSKISYMDQCTFGAGPLRGAGGERPDGGDSRIPASQGGRSDPPSRVRLRWASGRHRPASRPSSLPSLAKRGEAALGDRCALSPCAPSLRFAVSPGRLFSQTLPFFRFPVRAAVADARITAKAIPPRLWVGPGQPVLRDARGASVLFPRAHIRRPAGNGEVIDPKPRIGY
jgi:hypothetical protein